MEFSFFLLFLFSSRRRHTRVQGDWSSDVCSSDLGGAFPPQWLASTNPPSAAGSPGPCRSEEHTSELQSPCNLVCPLLLEKKGRAMCSVSGRNRLQASGGCLPAAARP